jgi:hypothetical protein
VKMMKRATIAVALVLAIISTTVASAGTGQGRLGLVLSVVGGGGPAGHHLFQNEERLRLQVTISRQDGQVVMRRRQYANGEQILYYRLQPGIYRIAVDATPPNPPQPCTVDGERVKVQAGRISGDGVRCMIR